MTKPLTPAELAAAEADVAALNAEFPALAYAEVLRIVADVVTEANDCGGVDLNDLVTRLEQAGHHLPDEDDE